jgi:hypothetical protein
MTSRTTNGFYSRLLSCAQKWFTGKSFSFLDSTPQDCHFFFYKKVCWWIFVMGHQRVWIFPIANWRDPLGYFLENPMVMLFTTASGVVVLHSLRINCVEVESWKTWCQNQSSFTSWHWPRGLEHRNLRLHFHGNVSAFCAGFWKAMNCTQDFLSFAMTTFHWPIALKNSNFWQSSNRKVAFWAFETKL